MAKALNFERERLWGNTTNKRNSYPTTGYESKPYEMMRQFKNKLTKAQIKAIKEIEEAIGVEFDWEHCNRGKADYFIKTGRECMRECELELELRQ